MSPALLELVLAPLAVVQAPQATGCSYAWQPIFAASAGVDGPVWALARFDDGSGPALFAAGQFTHAGGVPANRIAKWNGSGWAALGAGLEGGEVYALGALDDGSGLALYAAGSFTLAGGAPANRIARWDGTSWSALGSGFASNVNGLTVHDDGSGPALVARFSRWNGGNWTGMLGPNDPAFYDPRAMLPFDAGAGPVLYVCAQLLGGPVLARLQGSQWSYFGSLNLGESFRALAVHDDGSGPALYVGGSAGSAFPNPAGVLRWNGTSWSNLGTGIQPSPGYACSVFALAVFDGGFGSALCAAGFFGLAGGAAASNIAAWHAGSWSPLGSGTDDIVWALCTYDDGSGPALFAGGDFGSAGGSQANHLAKWGQPVGCWTSFCEPGVSGVLSCPCANPPQGSGRGCDNSAGSGGARLAGSGNPQLALDTLAFTTDGERPTALSVLLQGTTSIASGTVFGQGIRCVSGALKRLYVASASGGAIAVPGPGDRSVSARSAALGDPIAPGTWRYYGVHYRDPLVLGGCPAASTFNITQQSAVLWRP